MVREWILCGMMGSFLMILLGQNVWKSFHCTRNDASFVQKSDANLSKSLNQLKGANRMDIMTAIVLDKF